jgi:hypothetical protein
MAPAAATLRTRNPVLAVVCAFFLILLIAGAVYLNGPAAPPVAMNGPASAEAKAYLPYLALSDVGIDATDNFMQQRVVEVHGQITNNGPRRLESVEVYCVFYGVDGREIHRERQAIVSFKGGALGPSQTRGFRLPFDALPEGWNQTIPHLVIASIHFAK